MKLFTPLLAIAFVGFALAPCARAQETAADADAVKTKLKQMEDSWEKALLEKDRGVAVVGDMLADDFAGVSAKGKKQDKSQRLEDMKKETDILSAATNENMDVHVYAPNLATVVGTSTEKGTDKNGKKFSRTYGWVDTWMERNGKWECIGEAAMQLPEKK